MRMSEYHRQREFVRPQLHLVRSPDGRLKPAGEENSVAADTKQESVQPIESVVATEEPAVPPVRRIPKLKLPHFPSAKLPKMRVSKKHFVTTAVVLAVAVLGIFGYGLTSRDEAGQASPSKDVLNVKDTEGPNFEAVLPVGKTIDELGGWARVSPADKEPVFAYVDMAYDVQMNISQQQLPGNLRTDTDRKIEELAKGFSANDKVSVNGLTAYLGTSIRGPQSVIFAKNDLLILIKSSSQLTSQQWAEYIASLE